MTRIPLWSAPHFSPPGGCLCTSKDTTMELPLGGSLLHHLPITRGPLPGTPGGHDTVVKSSAHQAHRACLTAGDAPPWQAVAPSCLCCQPSSVPRPGTALGAESLNSSDPVPALPGPSFARRWGLRRGAAAAVRAAGGADEGLGDRNEGTLFSDAHSGFQSGASNPGWSQELSLQAHLAEV